MAESVAYRDAPTPSSGGNANCSPSGTGDGNGSGAREGGVAERAECLERGERRAGHLVHLPLEVLVARVVAQRARRRAPSRARVEFEGGALLALPGALQEL